MQFDGQGNVTASYTVSSSATSAPYTATGTYSVTPGCLGTATLVDSSNQGNTLNFSILNTYGQGVDLLAANAQYVRTGSAHAAFLVVINIAGYASNNPVMTVAN